MRTKKTTDFMSAASLGASWLVDRQEEDGSIVPQEGFFGCYKTPWALAVTGHVAEANRLLDWIKKNCLEAPGEFHQGRRDSLSRKIRLYRNAYVLIAAQKLGRYDIANPQAIDRFCQYQHRNGGFFSFLSPDRQGPILSLHSSLAGWVCLHYGRYDQAIRCGDFLLRLMDLQPRAKEEFYYVYDTSRGKVVTQFPVDERINYVIDTERVKQHVFHLGAPMGFLADLYQSTGERRYLEGSATYFEFCSRLNEDSFRWPSMCKNGWGAALLYRAKRLTEYREFAERVAETTLLEAQKGDGSWNDFKVLTNDTGRGFIAPAVQITSEFVFELAEITRGLSAG
jgi:hypothetical protein